MGDKGRAQVYNPGGSVGVSDHRSHGQSKSRVSLDSVCCRQQVFFPGEARIETCVSPSDGMVWPLWAGP